MNNAPNTFDANDANTVSALAGGSHMSQSDFWPSVRKAFRQPRFIAAVVMLAIAGLGLNAAAGFLKLHFRKLAVPLPVPSLRDEAQGIPSALGHVSGTTELPAWVQVSHDEPLADDVEQSLGTREHVFRDYVNVGLLLKMRNSKDAKERIAAEELWGEGEFVGKGGPFADLRRNGPPQSLVDFLAGLRSRSTDDRNRVLTRLGQIVPHASMRMSMTYYTGLVDTVAHIPERCFVADGYEPVNPETLGGAFTGFADGRTRNVNFRFIQFDDQTGARSNKYVGYLFHVNGSYESAPLDVRKRLQRLTERYGYYSKVELMTGGGDPRDTAGRERAAAAMTDFLQAVLPSVEHCLPDWNKVSAGQ